MADPPAGDLSPASSRILLVAWLLPILTLLLHLATCAGYGYFRDELYYLANGEHLGFGYVEHPPLIGVIAWLVRATLGDSVFAVRFLPAVAAAATVWVTMGITREMGGSGLPRRRRLRHAGARARPFSRSRERVHWCSGRCQGRRPVFRTGNERPGSPGSSPRRSQNKVRCLLGFGLIVGPVPPGGGMILGPMAVAGGAIAALLFRRTCCGRRERLADAEFAQRCRREERRARPSGIPGAQAITFGTLPVWAGGVPRVRARRPALQAAGMGVPGGPRRHADDQCQAVLPRSRILRAIRRRRGGAGTAPARNSPRLYRPRGCRRDRD
jgi:hypothetical protein